MSDREAITPEKRAAIIDGIQRTSDPEVLRYTRENLRDRGLLADADILAALRDQMDRVKGVRA